MFGYHDFYVEPPVVFIEHLRYSVAESAQHLRRIDHKLKYGGFGDDYFIDSAFGRHTKCVSR